VNHTSLPKTAKIITSTWAKKKKSNGVFRARLAARGFQQQDGVHYESSNTSSPVVYDITTHIFFVLAIMAGWHIEVLDVMGAFLYGEFEDGEEIYMEISLGLKDSMKLTQF
jgi:Reverse transcriptase (RNA-dependent DNA polymerase)